MAFTFIGSCDRHGKARKRFRIGAVERTYVIIGKRFDIPLRIYWTSVAPRAARRILAGGHSVDWRIYWPFLKIDGVREALEKACSE